MISRALILAALACAAASAADTYTDLRLQLGLAPGFDHVSYELSNGATSPDYTLDADSGFSIEGLASHGFASARNMQAYFQIGGALRGASGTDEVGWDHTITVFTTLVGGGLAWRPSEHTTVEFGPLLALGSSMATEKAGGLESDGDGSYAAIDLRLGAYRNVGRLQIGLVGGVGTQVATATHTAHPGFVGSPDVDAEYRGSGGYLLLSLGLRL